MKNKTTAPQSKKALPPIETIPIAPKREGFSMADFRMAMKAAENPQTPSRIKLLDYYNDILLDLHLTAVTDKRLDKIQFTTFRFTDNDGKENEAVNSLMRSSEFRLMTSDWVKSKFTGAMAYWVDLSGGIFNNYNAISPKHYIPHSGMVVNKVADRQGVDITAGNYPNYVMRVGKADDLGLLLKAIPWVLLKRGDISDWATFNELFAFPFRVAKYPSYNEAARDELATACRTAVSKGFAIIPNETSFEFINAQANSSADAFERFADFCDKQISKGFIRNTMTLDAEGGNYKGDVHQQSEDNVFASDRQFVLDILNGQFLRLLEIHGFNPGEGHFMVEEEDHICLKERIDIDMKLANKIVIPADYYYKKYGIPVPDGGAQAIIAASPVSLSDLTELTAEVQQLRGIINNQPMAIGEKGRGFFR